MPVPLPPAPPPQPSIAAIAGGTVGALLGAILLLLVVALLYTALSRRRRVQQNARVLAEGGCGSVGSSERDKDSANEKSCHKIPVRAPRFSYVHTAKRALLAWLSLWYGHRRRARGRESASNSSAGVS